MAIERYWLLSCPRCQWERELDTQSAQQLLRSQGLLRRRNDVDAAELQELLVAVSGRVACEACKECGIEIGEAEDFGDDPGEVRCHIIQTTNIKKQITSPIITYNNYSKNNTTKI